MGLKINVKVPNAYSNNNDLNVKKEWIKLIDLEQYLDKFEKHLYHDTKRVKG